MRRQTRIGAYGILVAEDDILLCRLTRSRLWTLPGGGLEFGESPEAAVCREFREETGLDVAVQDLERVHSQVGTREDVEIHAVQLVFRVIRLGGTLQSEVDGTTDLCAWYPLVSASGLATTGVAGVVLSELAGA